MHRLTGVQRPYAWGSTSAIHELLGQTEDGEPLAEVWFGAHPTGPSTVHGADAETLDALIASDPETLLGASVAEKFGNRLPFLLKFLAPGQPVSLQVHPSPEAARAGFERENAADIALTAFDRTFKDSSHKPEMIFALTAFEGLIGFRSVEQILRLLDLFNHDVIRAARAQLALSPDAAGLRSLLATLVQLPTDQVNEITSEAAALHTAASMARLRHETTSTDADALALATVGELAVHFSGDAGVVASLLLNRVTVPAGQAVFVASGVPHAYLSGLAVEVMANSDNVIRAGLTGKYVDVDGLLDNTLFVSGAPALVSSVESGPGIRTLEAPAVEFGLVELTASSGSAIPNSASSNTAGADPADPAHATTHPRLDSRGPRVAVCVEGQVEVTVGDQKLPLAVGEAIFVADAEGPLSLTGDGRLIVAGVPVP